MENEWSILKILNTENEWSILNIFNMENKWRNNNWRDTEEKTLLNAHIGRVLFFR